LKVNFQKADNQSFASWIALNCLISRRVRNMTVDNNIWLTPSAPITAEAFMKGVLKDTNSLIASATPLS